MTDYDNSNRIALWFNDKREKQTHPHLRGQGETTEEVWASAWFSKDIVPEDGRALMEIIRRHRQSSNKPFLSVSLQAKDDKPHQKPGENLPPHEYDDDSSIPF